MGNAELVIIGAGGLGMEYAWVAGEMNPRWRLAGFVDDAADKKGQSFGGCTVLGTIEEAAAGFAGKAIYFGVAVGRNATREKLAQRALAAGWLPATLIHPSVIIAGNAHIGVGSYVAPGCVICPQAQVGDYVIVNTHVSVGHHSVLGDYSQICPGARVSGACRVGRHAFLGSNASLNPGVKVGDGGVVGANSHAIRSVAAGATVLGVPAMAIGMARPKPTGDRSDG